MTVIVLGLLVGLAFLILLPLLAELVVRLVTRHERRDE